MTRGFTLIEVMVAMAVVAILAMMAVPSFQDRIIRAQVVEGMELAALAKKAVAAHYAGTSELPEDNEEASLPPPDRIVGTRVSRVAVEEGAIVITFGNQANGSLAGKKLSLRPAVVEGYPQVPIAWICAAAAVPAKMTVHGTDHTDIPPAQLPLECRPRPR